MTMTVAPRLRAAAIAADERGFAGLVEESVGLVEHQQPRLPVKRAGQRHPLRLACGEARAHQPERRVITLRKLEDQLVHPGFGGRRDHRFVDLARFVGALRLREAGDVLLDRAFEQRRLLRHVAEIRPKRVLVPIGQAGVVEPHGANGRLKRSDEDLAERRLARSAGADDAEDLAGLGAEGDAHQDRPPIAAANADLLDLEQALGRWQRGVDAGFADLFERVRQAANGGARGGERGPGADDAFDRLERAAQQHRRSDDRACRNIAGDGQQCAEAERGGLDEQAEELAGRGQPRPDICASTMLASAMPR